ncbi:MAG: TolC family outer membrane protein [Pseudomonadota bacterium]
MKKKLSVILLGLAGCLLSTPVLATDLIEAYNDALKSDPTYLAAQSTYHAALQDTPISRAVLLPQLSLGSSSNGSLFLNKVKESGAAQTDNTTTSKGYGVALSLSQSIFDFTAIEEFRAAQDTVKAAAATYYAALQTLIVTVATDYFSVLEAQENLRYAEANVVANKSSLTQAQQQYRVGTNTQTDVYTAQAAYSTAVSQQVAAQNSVADAIETLRAVTGKEYKTFSALNKDFPLVSPDPKKVNDWVKAAVENNPALKAAHYTATAAMKTVSAEWGGHLPTVNLNASYGTDYQYQTSDYISDAGSSRTNTGSVGLDVTIPIFEGGLVTAQTRQAEFNYETAIHNLELEHRTVETSTRVDYLNVMSAISAVQADETSVKSNVSALRGLEAGYRVGTQTMIDVLNQQSLLYQSEQSYAADRYNYVTNLVNLKSDTGILGLNDIEAINDWLGDAAVIAKSEDANKKYELQALQNNYHPKTNPAM